MNEMTDSAPPTVADALPLVKPCPRCSLDRPLDVFPTSPAGGTGADGRCKYCVRLRGRRFPRPRKTLLQRPRPERKSQWAAYERRPEVKRRRQSYRRLPKVKKYLQRYQQHRLLTDPAFKLTSNLRRRVHSVLRGRPPSAHTLDLIGCDVDFLRRWLEAKFQPGMTWENYGEWHVDHIMPCASFDLSDPVQQRTCFRWTNLQPLWASDNIRKSDNYAP